MNLNDDYLKLDPSGVEKALTLFPEQIKTTFKQAISSSLSSLNFDSVIVSGMGGSSNAGKIIQGLLEGSYDKQFVVYNDYDLPSWVNKNTLVVVNSYSGNTEESLSAIASALKIGSQIVGIATGGKIGEMITTNEILGVIINPEETNPTGFPKSGLGVSLGGLIGTLIKVGVLKITEQVLNTALDELVEIRKTWDTKSMAEWLHGSIPVLFGGRPFLGALNAGRNAMCEISRNFTEFYDFPEVNHVLVEATQKPASALNKKYIFFESKFNHDRVKLRFNITKDLFTEQGLTSKTYELKTSSILSQSLELAHYCAWIGFYISILDDTDPGPEPWIIKLKESLSQPVH
ncbi:MAG: SIS domain-containing protein [Candidatus Woesebacteria bacterium]|nr:SIS domain-containing protein [Candidatus Woesebacteria bacterium]